MSPCPLRVAWSPCHLLWCGTFLCVALWIHQHFGDILEHPPAPRMGVPGQHGLLGFVSLLLCCPQG